MIDNCTQQDFEKWADTERKCWLDNLRDSMFRTNAEPTPAELERFEASLSADWEREKERRQKIGLQARRKFIAEYGRAAKVALETSESDPVIALLAPYAKSQQLIVLSGPVGVGKTVGQAWLAWQRPYLPAFVTATQIATTSRYDADAEWKKATELAIDDLGVEYLDAKGSLASDIEALVDAYYRDEQWLCITTNLPPPDFADRYGQRVMDRLREAGVWISVTGKSRRSAP